MKPASIIAAFALFIAMTAPVRSAGAPNTTLEVGVSDLCGTVPLCTYWYTDRENRGITPVMTVTNNGFAPISVSDARLANGEAEIRGVPCDLVPSGRIAYVLTETPTDTIIQKRAAKYAVIFTISRTGE